MYDFFFKFRIVKKDKNKKKKKKNAQEPARTRKKTWTILLALVGARVLTRESAQLVDTAPTFGLKCFISVWPSRWAVVKDTLQHLSEATVQLAIGYLSMISGRQPATGVYILNPNFLDMGR